MGVKQSQATKDKISKTSMGAKLGPYKPMSQAT
eukprot:COSAG05_NODE_10352_length_569_cov_0.721868_2_plen_32_part_01